MSTSRGWSSSRARLGGTGGTGERKRLVVVSRTSRKREERRAIHARIITFTPHTMEAPREAHCVRHTQRRCVVHVRMQEAQRLLGVLSNSPEARYDAGLFRSSVPRIHRRAHE